MSFIRLPAARLFLASLLAAALPALDAAAAPAEEAKKIEYLIRSVEQTSNAKFIRNGKTYDAHAAAAHLREKLRAGEGRIRTADDFIRYCASGSSVTGKPYQIRFDDGKVLTSEQFLRAKLRELDQRAAPRKR
jgi:hypothetical protein